MYYIPFLFYVFLQIIRASNDAFPPAQRFVDKAQNPKLSLLGPEARNLFKDTYGKGFSGSLFPITTKARTNPSETRIGL
jgi:hypothetical protein